MSYEYRELPKSQLSVIPADAGIRSLAEKRDTRFRGYDGTGFVVFK